MQQYGIQAKQLWLNGNDQSTLNQYQNLMQGMYFNIQHVPFDASQKDYPGLTQYISAMKQYQPKWVYDEVALQGWQSAALLVPVSKPPAPTRPSPASSSDQHDHGRHCQRPHLAGQLEAWRRPHLSHYDQHLQRLYSGPGSNYVTVNARKPVFVCFELAGSILNGSGSNPGSIYTRCPHQSSAGTPVG